MRQCSNSIKSDQNESLKIDKRIADQKKMLKMRTVLPHMVANVGEILDISDDEFDGDKQGGSGFGQRAKKGAEKKKVKALVIKTTGRHTIFLNPIGMVEADELKPGELIAVNKDSFVVYEKLPPEYDSRVKAMEIDERPVEEYSDIGGLDKQIEELVEAIVLPMTHKEKFVKLGIRPPKGLLLHGPPGTGKTLMARACAA